MLRSPVFLGGQAVSMLGDGMAILAIPLLVLQVSRSPVLAVLASLPGSAGYLVAGLPAGVLVDRLDPWQVLIAADILLTVIFLVLFAMSASPGAPAWLILSLAFVAGVLTVFSDTAMAIAVRDMFAGPRLVSANSWLEAANQGGQIIGPGAAGVLAAAGLLHVSLLLDALTFGVALVTVSVVRQHPQVRDSRPASARGLRRELAQGLRYLAATRLLLTLLYFMLVINLCLGADKLIIFMAKSTLTLPAAQIGLVVTAGGVGGLLGAAGTAILVRRAGPLPAVTLCAGASGVALIVVSVATTMPVLLVANLFYTWAIVAASVTMRSLRQALVPRALLGRVTASWRLGGQFVTLAGGVLAGAVASLLGGDPRPVFAGAGAVTMLTVGVAWLTGLRKQDASAVAVTLLGSQGQQP